MGSSSSTQKGQFKEAQIKVNCQLCGEESQTDFLCIDCSLYMCRTCNEEKHSKFKNAASHRIKCLKEKETEKEYDEVRFSDVICQDHDSQSCCVVCKTCNKFICFKCITQTHNGHYFIDKEEGFRFIDVICQVHRGQPCCMFCRTCNKLICLKCIPRIHNEHDFIDEEQFSGLTKSSVIKRKTENESEEKNAHVRTEKPKLIITRQFVSDLKNIHFVAVCTDGSLWLNDNLKKRLQHVRLRDNDIQIISKINTKVYDMAVASSGDILLSVQGRTSLKQISDNKSEIINTKYNISPLHTRGIHVTSDNKVIISAKSPGSKFPRSGRRVVIVMNQEGNTIKECEYDKTNTPLFTLPIRVTSTSNGNICVVDRLDDTHRGRLVILSQGGDVISVYTGLKDIEIEKSFEPEGLVTTQKDNIIITEWKSHSLHILNPIGQLITYFSLCDMGIKYPFSLCDSKSNILYIGGVSDIKSSNSFRSTLYEIEYTGI